VGKFSVRDIIGEKERMLCRREISRGRRAQQRSGHICGEKKRETRKKRESISQIIVNIINLPATPPHYLQPHCSRN
jgi:hypothetical protein